MLDAAPSLLDLSTNSGAVVAFDTMQVMGNGHPGGQ